MLVVLDILPVKRVFSSFFQNPLRGLPEYEDLHVGMWQMEEANNAARGRYNATR